MERKRKKKGFIITLIILASMTCLGGVYWFMNPYLLVEGHYTSDKNGTVEVDSEGNMTLNSGVSVGFGGSAMRYGAGSLKNNKFNLKFNVDYKIDEKAPPVANKICPEGNIIIRAGINGLTILDKNGKTISYERTKDIMRE